MLNKLKFLRAFIFYKGIFKNSKNDNLINIHEKKNGVSMLDGLP